jgi:hypothetical protein
LKLSLETVASAMWLDERDSRIAPLFARDEDNNSTYSQFVDAKARVARRVGGGVATWVQGTMGLSCSSPTLDSSINGSAAARVESAQTE